MGEPSNGGQREGSRAVSTSVVIFTFVPDLGLGILQQWPLCIGNWNWISHLMDVEFSQETNAVLINS